MGCFESGHCRQPEPFLVYEKTCAMSLLVFFGPGLIAIATHDEGSPPRLAFSPHPVRHNNLTDGNRLALREDGIYA
jgi:hypothetical protein